MLSIVDLLQSESPRAVAVLLDAAMKACLVLAGAGVAAMLLRRANAALRHLVWLLALGSLLCLPVLSVVLPQWQIAVLPDLSTMNAHAALVSQEPPVGSAGAVAVSGLAGPVEVSRPGPSISRADDGPVTAAAEPHAVVSIDPLSGRALLLAGWLAGVLMVSMPLLVGMIALMRRARHATPLDGVPADLLHSLCRQMEIRRPVSLLCTRDAEIPATWGLFRPAILVPANAVEWPEQRCRVVLLHELAHIRRMDWLTLLMARLVRILYWYHPLVWLAARMQRIEAEQSCDDQVLSAGLKPSDYARQLLDIVVSLRRPGCSSLAAVAMARKSSLEGRVLSILDPMRRRGHMTWLGILCAVSATAALVVPVSILRAGLSSSSAPALVDGTVKEDPTPVASPSKAELQADTQKDDVTATQPVEKASLRASPARWDRYAVTKTTVNKDGQEVQQLSFLLPKEYEAKAFEDATEQVTLQVWLVQAMPGTDLSGVAKILRRSPASRPVAGKAPILRPGEHAMLSDEQLRELLAAARKCGAQGAKELPTTLTVDNHGTVVSGAKDGAGVEVEPAEQDDHDKSRFEIMSHSRLAAKIDIAAGKVVKMDCMLHSVDGGGAGPLKPGLPTLRRMVGQAAAEVPARSSLVMQMSINQVKLAAYRRRTSGDKPGVDIYMEPVPQAQASMAGFVIIRPVISKARGSATQEISPEQANDDAFTPDASPGDSSSVAQTDTTDATLAEQMAVRDEILSSQDRVRDSWPKYADVKQQLEAELANELDYRHLGTEDLVRNAAGLRDQYWRKGGELSYDACTEIYKAQILLESAHERSPSNLAVVDELVETMQSWQCSGKLDPVTKDLVRDPAWYASLLALRSPQFEQIKSEVTAGRNPTWQDFAAACDLMALQARSGPEMKSKAHETLGWLVKWSDQGGWGYYRDRWLATQAGRIDDERKQVAFPIHDRDEYPLPEEYRYSRRLPSFRASRQMSIVGSERISDWAQLPSYIKTEN